MLLLIELLILYIPREYNNKRVNCYITFFLKYMAGDTSVVECYTQGGYNE